ncbi:MAG: hypothetical protein MHMPM18_001817 [Marteilia pararefringens]
MNSETIRLSEKAEEALDKIESGSLDNIFVVLSPIDGETFGDVLIGNFDDNNSIESFNDEFPHDLMNEMVPNILLMKFRKKLLNKRRNEYEIERLLVSFYPSSTPPSNLSFVFNEVKKRMISRVKVQNKLEFSDSENFSDVFQEYSKRL